jgi:MoxR-like ATPase
MAKEAAEKKEAKTEKEEVSAIVDPRMNEFVNLLDAGYSIIWLTSSEEDSHVLNKIRAAVGNEYQLYEWDVERGVRGLNVAAGKKDGEQMTDPAAPIKYLIETLGQDSVIILKDYDVFLKNIEVQRAIKNHIPHMRGKGKHIVIMSSGTSPIPESMEHLVTMWDFPLPSLEELTEVAERLAKGCELKIDKKVLEHAKGMTLHEAENAISRSFVTDGALTHQTIELEKLQVARKSGLIEIVPPADEKDLGGVEPLKKYIHNRKRGYVDVNMPAPKGILLVGPPGAGKSLTAKVISSVFGFPLVRLDVGGLKGSLVGQSEARMKKALNVIDAISPCVVWIDEIEKALGGVMSSNRTDGGTTSQMFGYLLTWMQESKAKKFIVATSNDIDDLRRISQGALLRRFDDVFFVDLPTIDERKVILEIMNRRYGSKYSPETVNKLPHFSGAEIEKFVIGAIYDGEEVALSQIKPLYLQNREHIERARQWALKNARFANVGERDKVDAKIIAAEADAAKVQATTTKAAKRDGVVDKSYEDDNSNF